MKTGTNASIGPGLKPRGPDRLPSSNTSTSMPKAAAVESRLSRIALIGMTRERNATSSSRNERNSTKPITIGIPSE